MIKHSTQLGTHEGFNKCIRMSILDIVFILEISIAEIQHDTRSNYHNEKASLSFCSFVLHDTGVVVGWIHSFSYI